MISDHTYAEPAPPADSGPATYTPCEHCSAPLDGQQRYCLNCGTRRKHADDPAARFLAGASRRQKPASGSVAPPARGGSISIFTLIAILLIPLALGLGVLVAHSSSPSTPDAKLLSALDSGKAAGAGTAAIGSSAPTSAASPSTPSASPQLVTGSWSRLDGYAIQLSVLSHGTTPTAAAKLEQTDRSRGAKTVGVLATSAYHITPSPGGAYVIYSGSYATSAAATKALSSLRGKFPSARVIHVVSPSSSLSTTKVVSHTQYGSAHQVVGYKPNTSALKQGANVAAQDAKSKGKAASGAGLPDVVSVP